MPAESPSASRARAGGNGDKKKVAVLGGGAGGLTAAYELARQGDFDVTVYQLGWRLGGKGASGRNAQAGNRIEEHGLHIWFGFYANAFALMGDVYRDLRRPSTGPNKVPLATIAEAFTPCDDMVLYDRVDGRWHAHPFRFPRVGSNPWDKHDGLPTFWHVALKALERARGLIESVDPFQANAMSDAGTHLSEAEALAQSHVSTRFPDRVGLDSGLFVRKLRGLSRALRVEWGKKLSDPRFRFVYTTIDAFTAMAAGILEDDVLDKGFGAIDGSDWACWLKRHGASRLTIGATFVERAPILRSVYDVAFCFPGGDVDKASAAAGTATSDLLRLQFTYRGAIAYKMTAGMGDAIFAPLYQALLKRGVKFRFFHAATKLSVSPDGRRIEAIEIVPQVGVPGGEYDPLVSVKGLPCWPSEPLWDQLEDGASKHGTRFEADLNPLGRPPTELRLGRDFDHVVLAIPVGALREICGDLMKQQGFWNMVDGSATVATQAFQVWTREPQKTLGYAHQAGSIVSSYVEPLDTFCDMEHLLPMESWRPDEAKGVAYACGVLPETAGETPDQATARARANALAYLRDDLAELWPKCMAPGPGAGFRWDVLVDPAGRSGEARFDAQYWRANVAPWERYVITPAGNPDKRLPPDDSGFENLVLAGDWTKTAINGGCVEAAVMSGMQAARALAPTGRKIVGEDFKWLTPL